VATILPLLVFGLGTLLVTAAAYATMGRRAAVIDRRLRDVMVPDGRPPASPPADLAAFFKRVGERIPRSPAEMGKLQLRLVQAGYRRPDALMIFLGARLALALVVFAALTTPIFVRPNVGLALAAVPVAYLLPGMVLARMAKRRQHRIRLSLADAVDLLVVSVEAGLGLDQALARVGHELTTAYPELASELRLVNLELLAGTARPEALRNLAARTGVEDLNALVAMLVQTDKFGTSVATSLRVFSDTLRTKRRQRAEEAAAKTGVKMVFPLVLCIFPAVWIVTIGPAAIKFIRVLGPMGK
jgi:tight adherence protein C